MRAVYPRCRRSSSCSSWAPRSSGAIAAEELTAIANNMVMQTFRSFEIYIVVAVIYFVVVQAGEPAVRSARPAPVPVEAMSLRDFDPQRSYVPPAGDALDHPARADRLRRRRHARPGHRRAPRQRRRARCAGWRQATSSSSRARRSSSSCSWPITARRCSATRPDPWTAAAVTFCLNGGAFFGEIFRGAIEAIPKGQWEASTALGFRFVRTLRLVILPQAFRLMLPPTVGFMVQIVKSTSVASLIGLTELARAAVADQHGHLRAGAGVRHRGADLFRAVLAAVALREPSRAPLRHRAQCARSSSRW